MRDVNVSMKSERSRTATSSKSMGMAQSFGYMDPPRQVRIGQPDVSIPRPTQTPGIKLDDNIVPHDKKQNMVPTARELSAECAPEKVAFCIYYMDEYMWDHFNKTKGVGLNQHDPDFPGYFRFWKKELPPQHPNHDEVALWIDMWGAVADGIDIDEDDEMGEIFSTGRKHNETVGDGRKGTIGRKYICHAMNVLTKENLIDKAWHKSLEAYNKAQWKRKSKKWTKK